MNPIEAKVKRSYYVRLVILSVLTFGIGLILMLPEYRRWGRTFDSAGVTRHDGKQFMWADLQEKKYVHIRARYGAPGMLNNIELVFPDGKALVFPLMLENAREVMAFVEQLPGKKQVISHL